MAGAVIGGGVLYAIPATPTHAVIVTHTGNFSCPEGTTVNVPFDAAPVDTDGFYQAGTPQEPILIPVGLGGFYVVTANALVTTPTNVTRLMTQVVLKSNHRAIPLSPVDLKYTLDRTVFGDLPYTNVSSVMQLVAGDKLVLEIHSYSTVNEAKNCPDASIALVKIG